MPPLTTVALLFFHLIFGSCAHVETKFLDVNLDPKIENSNLGRRFTYDNGSYELSAMRTDWFTARNYCKVQGGELLSIETLGENTAVLSALRDYMTESFWTCGTELYLDGNFYWDTTGEKIDSSFTYWGANEPVNNNTEQCLELNSALSHMWADNNCTSENFFICEFQDLCTNFTLEAIKNVAVEVELQSEFSFTFEDGYYEIVNITSTWVEAKNDCKAKGMQLVSIESFDENQAILNAILGMPEQQFWTSGSDLGHEGNFYWEATGYAVGPYTSWAPGHPSNSGAGQHCLALTSTTNHLWNDIENEALFNYICEKHFCQ